MIFGAKEQKGEFEIKKPDCSQCTKFILDIDHMIDHMTDSIQNYFWDILFLVDLEGFINSTLTCAHLG